MMPYIIPSYTIKLTPIFYLYIYNYFNIVWESIKKIIFFKIIPLTAFFFFLILFDRHVGNHDVFNLSDDLDK